MPDSRVHNVLTDVRNLTNKQPGEETHVQTGLHDVQTGSGELAKWLRSSSQSGGQRRRQEAADVDRNHGENKNQTKRTKGSKDYYKHYSQLEQQKRKSASPVSVTVTVNLYHQKHLYVL